MPLTRRQFVAASAVASAAPAAAAAAQKGDALNILLVGDWGRNGREGQSAVARQMGLTAAAIGSAYTVSVGDNFYENGVTSLHDPQWQSSFERIYTAPALQTPWKIILGNHDYRGNVQAQIDYSRISARWRLPARYYTETVILPDGTQAAFFYLDTSPFISKYLGTRVAIEGQSWVAQAAWLDRELTRSTAPWKIVIGHHPIYSSVSDSDGYEHDQPDLIARLDPILQKHQIPLYVCGHDHCLQALEMNGITYVVTGAGSATYEPQTIIRNGFASGAHGFMAMRLTGTTLDYSLIDSTGTPLYAQTITRA